MVAVVVVRFVALFICVGSVGLASLSERTPSALGKFNTKENSFHSVKKWFIKTTFIKIMNASAQYT